MSSWQISCIFALVIAILASNQVLGQATLPNELAPNKKEEIHQDIKGAIQVRPEDQKILESEQANPKPTPAKSAEPPLFGVHAALGVPHPLSFGLDYLSAQKNFSVALNIGAYAATVSAVDVSLLNSEIGLAYHPWSGAFFVGVLFGQQTIKAKKTVAVASFGSINAEAAVKSNYVTPRIGWNAVWASGFSMGFELGFQSPYRNSTDFTTNVGDFPGAESTAEYQQLQNDVQDNGDKIGKMGLPYISLLRLGWLF